MKKAIYFLLFSVTFVSCTKEVFIEELLNAESRIVIEANIDIDKYDAEASKNQTITISKTSDYYSQDYEPVLNATISVTDADGNTMGTFLDDQPLDDQDNIDGVYTAIDFTVPTVGQSYFISVTIDGETFTANDTYNSIVDFDEITSKEANLFDDDVVEITIDIENEIGVNNYFLIEEQEIKLDTSIENDLPNLDVFDDEIYSEETGENKINIPVFVDEASTIKQVDFTLYGISEEHYNFLNKILTQASSGGDPFSTAPAQIKGNFVNQTNQDNFVYGYFSINQFVKASHELNN